MHQLFLCCSQAFLYFKTITKKNNIQTYGLKNYTINLMTMDYGSAGPGNCVVANGTCQMGQSAIQAAMNLHDHWGAYRTVRWS
ncbi:hypothetical protein [Burkholderia ubonensis]|uniref:hypothetical protein n=1 Tax=Burkholderia ubonensis TaxID=101571 RepID=UPI001E4E51B6|nr:hypothetical protein [Burkholderia ubonensis]